VSAPRAVRGGTGLIARVLVVAVFLGLLSAVQVVSTAPPASAAPVTDFKAGNIISDAVMRDSSTMSAAAVQTFLDARGSGCKPASGSICVKDYRESTPSRSADALCTRAYTGASNESAATIIAKVATACGINPQVLIVTLQKEQGLITATAGKTPRTYARALGFGCPDNVGGWCDPQYAGFANQVYSAAKQLRRYESNPNGYSYRAGRTNTVLWHPNASCGTTQVYIENQATASLYNYTPYAPNAAALAAGYGSGDACSSYGNRNFHLYFQSWFGGPTNQLPIGRVESVTSQVGSGTIRVQGWALDPDTTASVNVHVYLDGKVVTGTLAGMARPDVDKAYGKGAAHGYDLSISATSGPHTVCVYAIDSTGGPNPAIGCSTVQVTGNQAPKGEVEDVTSTSSTIRIRGWALDPDTTASINVHVYVDGKLATGATASGLRPDIGRLHGLGDAHGYDITVPAAGGRRSVCVFAINATPGTNPTLGCRTVTVTNQPPTGAFDSATPSPGSVRLRGWALDPDTSAPIAIHVYVDGKLVTGASASSHRADIGRIFGLGESHGFDVTIPASNGTQTVCVFAINATPGANPRLGCKTVTVINNPPRAAFDGATSPAPGTVAVRGWAFDPDVESPIQVHAYVDGRLAGGLTASTPRPDVARVHGVGENHGFDTTLSVTAGKHSVCLFAINVPSGSNPSLGCKEVDVANTVTTGAVDTVTTTASATGTPTAPATRSTLTATGWAWDFDTTTPVAVELLVDDVVVASGQAALRRTDVAAGRQDVGYTFTVAAPPGAHTVCVRASDSPAAAPVVLGCQDVSVPNTPARGAFDSATVLPSGAGIRVGGWAMDVDTSASIPVHVWMDGALVANGSASGNRPDVHTAFGNGAARGYDLTFPAVSGEHQVCVYAIGWPIGTGNPSLGCRTVTVP